MFSPPEAPLPHDEPSGAPEVESTPRVMVVDDEASVLDVFREYLAAEGYEITAISSGEEAVRMLPVVRPDVILTDLNLPGLSGLDVMRHARAADPESAVIVVTGYASASTAIDALRQGAYDYVTKPPDLYDVAQIVQRAIAGRRLRETNRRLLAELRAKNQILQQHEQVLRERVRVATWQMTRLYEVGKEISDRLDLAPRLEVICTKAAELAGSQAAAVYLRDDESDHFHLAGAFGVESDESGSGAPPTLASEGLLLAEEDGPMPHRVGPGEVASNPGLPVGTGRRFDAMLAVPMVSDSKLGGVLLLLGKSGGFSSDDEGFLALYAAQAAIAVRNSQLFEHTKSLDRLKSEFVAVVSHEIRTPLTSVKGAVELLSDERYFKNTDQQAKLLTIAHANAERLLLLINDILDFSKLENASLPMTLEPNRLEPVLQQAVHNLRTMIEERRISLEMQLAGDLPVVMLDPARITQVVTNLLSNALKFSSPSGRIVVTAERWQGLVRVGVRDFGEGIAPQDHAKLFRKFSQIDSGSTRKVGGTGLGLVISKGIVEQHGGSIWVESTYGEGSTFYFTMPAQEAVSSEPASSQRAA
jgi:signal transduction histidine kinase/FixJ family two-component response regulator